MMMKLVLLFLSLLLAQVAVGADLFDPPENWKRLEAKNPDPTRIRSIDAYSSPDDLVAPPPTPALAPQ